MADLQPVRGTRDLIGEEQRRHAHVIDTARRTAALYGLEEWATPIFEETRVFARTLGDTSDVVTKEMYTFDDRGGDSITLRPENTAGVCRALVSNGLTQSLPQKVFYAGPMFRYERPQKGRYRQFHQIGAELIGPSEPLADAEVIALGWQILGALGVAGDTVLELNTLGDAASRAAYREALVAHFSAHRDTLSAESRDRLERNPAAHPGQQGPGRPRLSRGCAYHPRRADAGGGGLLRRAAHPSGQAAGAVPGEPADRARAGLLQPHGVRVRDGQARGAGRSHGRRALRRPGGADGRPAVPAVGWAAGIERLAMLLDAPPVPPAPVAVVPVGAAGEEAAALEAMQALRAAGIRAEMAYRGNLKRRMERANRIGARAAVIIGEAELARGVAQVKDLGSGEQQEVALTELVGKLA